MTSQASIDNVLAMARLEGREQGGVVILDEFSGECSLSDVARNELTGILLQCLDSDDKVMDLLVENLSRK